MGGRERGREGEGEGGREGGGKEGEGEKGQQLYISHCELILC